MATKKARGEALYYLEESARKLDKVIKAARLNDRDLKLKLEDVKAKRIIANDLNNKFLYEEKDEEARKAARENYRS